MGAGKTVEQWDAWTDDLKARHGNGNGHGKSLSIEAQRLRDQWGEYAPAILRWETVLGRRAPAPTDDKGRLSPPFVTWMMGWPEDWFEGVDLSRKDKLKILGNGVVPQQAAAAFGQLLDRITDEAVAA